MKLTIFMALVLILAFTDISQSRLFTEYTQARERQLSLRHKHKKHHHKKRYNSLTATIFYENLYLLNKRDI